MKRLVMSGTVFKRADLCLKRASKMRPMSKCGPWLKYLKSSTIRVLLCTHKMLSQFSKPKNSRRVEEAGGQVKKNERIKRLKGHHASL